MAKKPQPPTDGELEILRAMWAIGRARTLAIHKRLNEDRKGRALAPLAFNTTATVLGKLFNKGFVHRYADDPTRHEYATAFREQEVSRVMAADVIRRMFGGSLVTAVRMALLESRPSKTELVELKKLIAAQ